MRKSLVRPAGRRGFTLVELMMVIAIIGLLVAILAVALGPIMSMGPQMVARNDINQLGIALENFKFKYGFYPPSRLLLCHDFNTYNNWPNDPVANDSKYYLLKMFPRMQATWTNPGIPWNPVSTKGDSPTLSGDECLVFFLGGIQTIVNGTLTCNGFSANEANPIPSGNTTNGPYFEFKADRLVTCANGFFSYMDGYKQLAPNGKPAVYAYFSAGRKRNGYNAYVNSAVTASDCNVLTSWDPTKPTTLSLGLYPYINPGGTYYNPESFQIISPGKDGVFGVGSQVPNVPTANPGGRPWTPTPNTQYSPDKVPGVPTTAGLGDGRDDITNFNSTVLGKQ